MRRAKRSKTKLWRNIRFRILEQGKPPRQHDSASFFPKASIEMVQEGVSLWMEVQDKPSAEVEFLEFETFSDVWPDDGGHEWQRDSPLTSASQADRATWYKCKHCRAQAKRVGLEPGASIVRCTGDKICPAWRKKAQG